jgi:hypothetical protein
MHQHNAIGHGKVCDVQRSGSLFGFLCDERAAGGAGAGVRRFAAPTNQHHVTLERGEEEERHRHTYIGSTLRSVEGVAGVAGLAADVCVVSGGFAGLAAAAGGGAAFGLGLTQSQ